MNVLMKAIPIMNQKTQVNNSGFVQFFANDGVNLKGHGGWLESVTPDLRRKRAFERPGD